MDDFITMKNGRKIHFKKSATGEECAESLITKKRRTVPVYKIGESSFVSLEEFDAWMDKRDAQLEEKDREIARLRQACVDAREAAYKQLESHLKAIIKRTIGNPEIQ